MGASGLDKAEIRDAGTTNSFNDLGRLVPENTEGLDPEMLQDTEDADGAPINAGQRLQPQIAWARGSGGYSITQATTDMDGETKKELKLTYKSGKTLSVEGYLHDVMPISNANVGPAEQAQLALTDVEATGGFIPS